MNTEINNHGVLHLKDDCVTPMMSNVALRVLPASTTLEFKVKHSILSDLTTLLTFLKHVFISHHVQTHLSSISTQGVSTATGPLVAQVSSEVLLTVTSMGKSAVEHVNNTKLEIRVRLAI